MNKVVPDLIEAGVVGHAGQDGGIGAEGLCLQARTLAQKPPDKLTGDMLGISG